MANGAGVPPAFTEADISDENVCTPAGGKIVLNAVSVRCDSAMEVELRDLYVLDSTVTLAAATSRGDYESIDLTNVDGVFTGVFATDAVAEAVKPGDGLLQGWAEDQVILSYVESVEQ